MKETVKKVKVPGARRFVYFLGFCALLGLAVWGCSLPQAPGDLSWDTHLTVPLGIRTYGLGDLVKPDSVIEDSGSGIGLDPLTNTLYFAAYSKYDIALIDSLIVDPYNTTVYKPQGTTTYIGHANLPPQQHRLERGLIAEGSLSLTLRNLSGHSGTVVVTLPEFTSNSGDTLVITVDNVSGTAVTRTQNLHNYYMKLDSALSDTQKIALRIHDTSGDNIQMDASISRTSFIYYTGTLHDLQIRGLNSQTKIEKLPQGWEAVHPTSVDALVHMKRTVGATADVHVDMGTRFATEAPQNDTVSAYGVYLGRDTTVVRRGFAHMLGFNSYPDSLLTNARMGMRGRVVNCSGSDTVRLAVELRSPLSFRLNPMEARGDSDVRKIDNGELKSIKSDTSSYLRVQIWNHLPVGGHIYLIASNDSSHVYSSYVPMPGDSMLPDTVAGVTIPAAPISPGGYATADTMVQEFRVALDSATVELFKNPPFFARTDIHLDGAGTDTLVVRASDYVKVKIIAELERHVSSKGDDN